MSAAVLILDHYPGLSSTRFNPGTGRTAGCGEWALFILGPAPGADDPGIQPKPVHTSQKTGVLHFQAAVHHDHKAATFGDGRSFRADHVKLQPERSRSYAHCLLGDRGNRFRCSEHIDDIDRERNGSKRGIALLPRIASALGFTGTIL